MLFAALSNPAVSNVRPLSSGMPSVRKEIAAHDSGVGGALKPHSTPLALAAQRYVRRDRRPLHHRELLYTAEDIVVILHLAVRARIT